jgi:hypothetical protein
MPNLEDLTNFTVLWVQFMPRYRSVTVKQALKSKYFNLRFRVRILICVAAFKIVKPEFEALYTCFTGRRLAGSVRDSLRRLCIRLYLQRIVRMSLHETVNGLYVFLILKNRRTATFTFITN